MKTFASLAVLTALTAFTPAQAAPAKNTVVATVNGSKIHLNSLEQDKNAIPQLRGAKMDQVYPLLRQQAIMSELTLQQARKSDIKNDPKVKKQIAHVTDMILRENYLMKQAEAKVSDKKVRDFYDKSASEFKSEKQIKARHILVRTEDEARAIIKELNSGADFAKLAETKSIAPEGKNGGELPWLTKNMMVPEFSGAAFAIQTGKISSVPVKTEFGWHVIKVEDAKMTELPSFAKAKDTIRNILLKQETQRIMLGLVRNASIKYYKLDGSPDSAPPLPPLS